METLAERIRHLRGHESQDRFSRKIGININTLRGYEKGQRMPGADTIISICNYLRVSSEWLLFGAGPKMRDDLPRKVDENSSPTSGHCHRCAILEEEAKRMREDIAFFATDMRLERQKTHSLIEDYQKLSCENQELLKQNGDLRVELERAKARAAPEEEPEGASSGEDAAA